MKTNMQGRVGGKSSKGFTIVELLVIVVIIGILATIVFVVLNPNEMFKSSRDATRQTDLRSLDRAVSLLQTDNGLPPGLANVVYISLPDSNANCSSYTLPTLPAGWSYACKPLASYRNIDGTGWIPMDLTNVKSAKISQLPIDPVNTATTKLYYSYVTNSTEWEVSAQMEALSNVLGGSGDKTSSDGGDDPTRLEVGNNLTISPWNLEFKTFPIVSANSGFPGWYRVAVPTDVTLGNDGTSPSYARITGYGWFVWAENIPFNPDTTYKMTCTFRQITDPTAGGKGIYCGWAGVGADGITLVNASGSNSNGSQHYHTMSNNTMTPAAGWTSYTGYTKGWAAVSGDTGRCPNVATPCKLHPNVRYIRPLFIINYTAGNGVADVDSIVITKQ